jgi:hypothetical protein
MRKFLSLFFLFLFVFDASILSYGQCSALIKANCLPLFGKHGKNIQYNTTMLSPGGTVEMEIPILPGQIYRFVVCGENILGDLKLLVKNDQGKVLFDNENHQFTKVWDFQSQSVLNCTVSVIATNSKKGSPEQVIKGCVSIIYGNIPK